MFIKKQILLLHGYKTSSVSFFPTLRKHLEKEFDVIVPVFPNPDNPDVDEWTEVMMSLGSKKFHGVIAFSLGGAFALSLLTRGIISCKHLVLIAASPGPKDIASMNTFLRYPLDFPKIRSKTKKILTLQSLDDPWTFPEYGLLNVKHSGSCGLFYADKGHFEDTKLPDEAMLLIDGMMHS